MSESADDGVRVVRQVETEVASPYRLVYQNEVPVSWANSFLDSLVLRGLSPLTVRTYAYGMLAICRWLRRSSLDLEDLKESDILEFIQFLKIRAKRQGKSITHTTIKHRIAILRSVFFFHSGHDVPQMHKAEKSMHSPFSSRTHPFTGLPRWPRARSSSHIHVKAHKKLVRALAQESAEQFLRSLRTYRDLAITGLMLFSGLRSGEILTLQLDDIDSESGVCHVVGKGGRQRVVPIAESTKRVMRNYLLVERPEDSDPLLFVLLKGPRRGKSMTRAGLRSLFRYHRARSGASEANPHRFRHTFAKDMVRAGCTLPVLQRLLGHAHIDITMRYVHFNVADLHDEFRKAMASLERNQVLHP